MILVQSYATDWIRRKKSCLTREIVLMPFNKLSCSPRVGLHSSRIFQLGQFLIPWHSTELGTCFLCHVRNIGFFQQLSQFAPLAPQIMLVTCWPASCFGHMLHISFLVLDMVDVVFFAFNYWTGEGYSLNILTCKLWHTIFHNSISWLYHSIMFLPDLL